MFRPEVCEVRLVHMWRWRGGVTAVGSQFVDVEPADDGSWQVYISFGRLEALRISLTTGNFVRGFDSPEEAAAYCLLNGLVGYSPA